MSDELQAQFAVPDTPDGVIAAWKADPPKPIADGGYELEDESFNGLVYRARYLDSPAKMMKVLSFGMLGQDAMGSVWNLNVRFDADGHTRTRVTIVGKASEETRAALGELVAEHGGPVGLTYGV